MNMADDMIDDYLDEVLYDYHHNDWVDKKF